MSEFLSEILALFSFLVPPTLSGPVAAILFLTIIHRGEGRSLRLFWVALPLINLAVLIWISLTLDEFIGAGTGACILTPFTSVLSGLILLFSRRRALLACGDDLGRQRSYRLGMFLIPVLPLLSMVVMMVFAPAMCEWGLRECSDW